MGGWLVSDSAARWLFGRGCICRCVLYFTFRTLVGVWRSHAAIAISSGGLKLRDIASSRGWKRLRHGEPRSHCSLHTIWSTSGHLILDLTLRESATNRPRAVRSAVQISDLISHFALRRFAIPPIVAPSKR
jgi:hypothetical protein